MQEELKQQVLNAFLLVMRPIVRILLRYGIGYREFVEVTKTAYVDVASSDFGIRGRPTNISRVAVMTGLTRKEVKRLRDRIASGESRIAVKTTPLADVLHHWHAHSFSELVRRFGGDVPAGAMRTELKRVGAVTENDDGVLVVKRRVFTSSSSHERLLTLLVHGAYTLLSNVEHNTDEKSDEPRWAHRIAYTNSLRRGDTGNLQRVAKDRISEFAESIDDIFIAYEARQSPEVTKGDQDTIAVGVFYFEETDDRVNYEW
jgi:hypothetical protein